MKPWKTLDRETILTVDDGKFLSVEAHTVELPDGKVIKNWPWVVTPDFVNVVVRTREGLFLCFRQVKYASPDVSLAVTGGYLEPDEEPLAAAKRELLEETGYRADEWTLLGEFALDGNRGSGRGYLYFADLAAWSQPHANDDLEEQEMLLLSRDEMLQALLAGEFKIVTWTAAVAMALLKPQVAADSDT